MIDPSFLIVSHPFLSTAPCLSSLHTLVLSEALLYKYSQFSSGQAQSSPIKNLNFIIPWSSS